MAGDERPKGSQDRTVPCTTAKHQFAVANIMNRLDAYPFTRDPTPNSEYCRRTGLGGTDDGNCTSSAVEAKQQVLKSAS